VHAVWAVGNMWLHVDYDETGTKANPLPYHAGVYMGYDVGQKKFVQGCVDAFGSYCTMSSPGWQGDTIVFEGTTHSSESEALGRDTFVRKGTGELIHRGSFQGPDKQWINTDEETCHKGK